MHLDDGAAATLAALEHTGPAIYNIADDDPAPVRDWLPVLADALGAKPPRHVPTWLARLFAGPAAVVMRNRSPRRLQRQSEARTRLDAAIPQLAPGLPRHLLGDRGRRRTRARPRPRTDPGARLSTCPAAR